MALVLIVAVVALLFVVVFPWVEPRLPFTNVTVDEDQPSALRVALRVMTGRMAA